MSLRPPGDEGGEALVDGLLALHPAEGAQGEFTSRCSTVSSTPPKPLARP